MKVKDIMTKQTVIGTPSKTVLLAANKMAQKGVGALIIAGKNLPLGIITERDIVRKVVAMKKDPNTTKISEIMSEPLFTTSPNNDIREAAKIMSINEVRRLPVVENGKLVGILTATDIAKSLVGQLTGQDALLYAITRYHKYGY
ncbi:MAG: CBS domain-containing protein [Thaumarchaeota archaeon]|nr:CBS domain-containing protein [Nitrososphaerota archaeon]